MDFSLNVVFNIKQENIVKKYTTQLQSTVHVQVFVVNNVSGCDSINLSEESS